MTPLRFRLVARFADIPADAWDACLPGDVENHAYYAACLPDYPSPEIRTAAAIVEDGNGIVAVAPVFMLNFSLQTSFQGKFRSFADHIARMAPGLFNLKVLGVGSPYAERCHVGVRSDVLPSQRMAVLAELIAGLEREAAANRFDLLAWKDLADTEANEIKPLLEPGGYGTVSSLPVCVLDLPFVDEAAYLASLSAATRKDIRRKLAKSCVRIERRASIDGLGDHISRLYEATRQYSTVDYLAFEALLPDYFTRVSEALGDNALFVLYWVGDRLAAFNLLLIEQNRLIDKFLGMEYPLAREHDLYAVSWMENVRLCIERGIPRLQTGQTAYASKLRFGSRLEPSSICFRHRRRAMNGVLKALSPWLAFDRNDPDLGGRGDGRGARAA